MLLPRLNWQLRKKNASSGQNATSFAAISELGEHVGVNAFFGDASGNNKVLHVSNVIDETQNNISGEISELSVTETRLDRQIHTDHMVTGQTTKTNQISEFLTGRTLSPGNPPSQDRQELSTQVSQDNNFPMVEQTPRNQSSDAKSSINRLADATAGIATQERPQAAKMLRQVSTNTLIFEELEFLEKTKILNFLKTYFTQYSKCNQR